MSNRLPSTTLFRLRMMRAAGLAALAAPLVVGTACTSTVVVEDGEGQGGEGGTGGAPPTTSSVGGAPSTSSVGPTTSTSVGPTTSNSVGPTTSSVTTGVGGGGPTEITCFGMGPQGCPSLADASSYYGDCTNESFSWIVSWVSGPTIMGDTCCYEVETQGPCGIGRPLVVGERAVTARATRSDAWSRTPKADPIASLDDTDRAILSAAWTHDALYEHASVASFSRFALELMALGAPPELVAAAHQAALDELEHAKLCFALASRFAGEPVGAGPLDAARDLSVRADLKQLAVATFFEGCVGETLAALTAAEQRDRATDEATRSALTTIAEDEARHAELAWQTVAWALDIGGDDVRRALSAAVHEAGKHCPELPETDDPRLVAFGRLPAADVAALHRRAILDVVMPCAQALLARA